MSSAFGMTTAPEWTCPCSSAAGYDACCGPLHRGEREAATALELMRSRYSAYTLRFVDHLFRTWHPRTRPADLTLDTALTWTALDVVAVSGGAAGDEAGTVEFRARYRTASGVGELHEVSRFERRAGRWVYVDGDVLEQCPRWDSNPH